MFPIFVGGLVLAWLGLPGLVLLVTFFVIRWGWRGLHG